MPLDNYLLLISTATVFLKEQNLATHTRFFLLIYYFNKFNKIIWFNKQIST